jgi:hypothetical protein
MAAVSPSEKRYGAYLASPPVRYFHPKVDLVTTDGFLYPNRVLEERGLRPQRLSGEL